MNKHQALYENIVQHKNDNWKSTLYERFTEALKTKRSKLIDKLRAINLSQLDVTDEYLLKEKRTLLNNLIQECEAENLDMDNMLCLQEKTLEELSEEIEFCLHSNPEYSPINVSPDQCDSNENVLCPLCKTAYLKLNGTILTCDCSLRLDTQTDSLTLSSIKQSLLNVEKQHNTSGCEYKLNAWLANQQADKVNEDMKTDQTITFMCVGCNYCDFMEVVI